ncbi:alpha-N-acetylgalactosaminide alpha-2,6-sialyltransferase 1-like [Bombina bombina]|uniref:alpha-N-acetylgalactosaminide alpha-2,6-sialyltransferase 1-like n=1 Tax=Bombina bombina TaxID=8345 RepID=UPI00235AD2E6|nr:alpha-N-acetylgalactosaminide alpha-2,6-sialyltransferase 1-like [Bombina bombina]
MEWKRLQRFNPPYGWMEVNYNVIKRVISWLPDQTHLSIHNRSSDPQCVTCAVVGNGGILKGSNMGREIDLHDYIFRGNGAAIKGFEKDVGHRTSFYGFTESTVRECLRGLTESGFTGIPDEQVFSTSQLIMYRTEACK